MKGFVCSLPARMAVVAALALLYHQQPVLGVAALSIVFVLGVFRPSRREVSKL